MGCMQECLDGRAGSRLALTLGHLDRVPRAHVSDGWAWGGSPAPG